MRKSVVILFTLFLFLTGCGNTETPSASQPEAPSSQVALPELEKTDWPHGNRSFGSARRLRSGVRRPQRGRLRGIAEQIFGSSQHRIGVSRAHGGPDR